MGGGVIGNNKVWGFKFVVVNDNSYFYARISRENNFFGSGSLVYVHLSYNYYEIGFCSIDSLIVYGFEYFIYISLIVYVYDYQIGSKGGNIYPTCEQNASQ